MEAPLEQIVRPRKRWLVPALIGLALGATLGIVFGRLGQRPTPPPPPVQKPAAPSAQPAAGKAKVEWIAYATESDVHTTAKVMMVRPDGTGARELPVDISDGSELEAVSPDGQWAVTCFAYDVCSNLTLVKTDGSVKRLLTDNDKGEMDSSPAFSRDGRRLVFRRWHMGDAGTGNVLLVLDLPDGAPRPFLPVGGDGYIGSPAFSPDSAMLAFNKDDDIAITNSDGTGQRRLFASKGLRYAPSFTADGTHIVYEAHAVSEEKPGWSDIAIVGIDGKGAKKLTDVKKDKGAAAYVSPVVSPSGTEIAFVRLHQEGTISGEDGTDFPNYAGDVYLMNLDGTNKRKLAAGTNPCWILREE
jgi:Tol biopolymer transport system component